MSALSRAPLVATGKAVAATVIIGAFMIIVPLAPVILAPSSLYLSRTSSRGTVGSAGSSWRSWRAFLLYVGAGQGLRS